MRLLFETTDKLRDCRVDNKCIPDIHVITDEKTCPFPFKARRVLNFKTDAGQAQEFDGLVGIRDPMDRLVVAAARATGSRLVSADDALDGFGVERVWD